MPAFRPTVAFSFQRRMSINPDSVAANTTAFQNVTVTGLRTDQPVIVWPDADLDAGLALTGYRVSAADTLRLQWTNPTAGAIDNAAINFNIVGF